MRKLSVFIFIILCKQSLLGQLPNVSKGNVQLINVFYPDSVKNIQTNLIGINKKFPSHQNYDPVLKEKITQQKAELIKNSYRFSNSKRAAINPTVVAGFEGAANNGTPNDNNMAINNDSFVVSVLNTNIRVYNTNGVFKRNWSLEFFPRANVNKNNGVGVLDRSYDPKIVFDPVANRFIIVYLEGSESSDTRIIVAFSKSSNPLDGWNVYQITGNPYGGSLWTDYPIIGINGVDLFITVNILKDNTDWRDGFVQSIIWQMPCKNGYDGNTLEFQKWDNIKFNNKSIWSICAVQEDFLTENGKGMYFLSVRPGDASNDTVFLHHISDNYNSGNAQYTLKVLKSPLKYGLPPFANQPQAGFRLQTNDARVLSAFYSDNKIQYVQTSVNPVNGRSSVFHGVIQHPHTSNPGMFAQIISYDSLELAYPSIACAGNNIFGRQSIITFSHVSESVKPGTSVIFFDNNSQYSDLIMAKQGIGYINSFIPDSMERWGDYTSIQRRYNANNEFWLVGSFGNSFNAVGTWISKVISNDPSVSNSKIESPMEINTFPNPVSDIFSISFNNQNQSQNISIQIYDLQGKIIETISSENLNSEQVKLFLNVSNYAQGIYFYEILIDNSMISTGKFSKI